MSAVSVVLGDQTFSRENEKRWSARKQMVLEKKNAKGKKTTCEKGGGGKAKIMSRSFDPQTKSFLCS